MVPLEEKELKSTFDAKHWSKNIFFYFNFKNHILDCLSILVQPNYWKKKLIRRARSLCRPVKFNKSFKKMRSLMHLKWIHGQYL